MLKTQMTSEMWRLTIFMSVLAFFTLAESVIPARARESRRIKRASTNIAILFTGALAVRFVAAILPAALAISVATWATQNNIGLLNMIALPFWLVFGVSVVFLDFAIWFQHVMTHNIPFLWRFHAVHHSDQHMDTTTALRFHPIEIVLSALYKSALAAIFGLPVLAILVFEIALNAFAIFNHANIRLPNWLDTGLRWVVVTPKMHLVHHSIEPAHQNTNFGFCLSIWDRVFSKYYQNKSIKDEIQSIGIDAQRHKNTDKILWSILYPFRG